MSAASSGRRLVERRLHGVNDGSDRLGQGFADLLGRERDRARQTADQVATTDVGGELVVERPARPHVHLDLLGGAIADREGELLLDVLHHRVVELVAGDADRLRGDDAAERDDRDLGGAAADVDDHVAARLVHRQVGADRRGHRLFDDVHRLARAGVLGGVLHGTLLDTGDARRHADHHARLAPPAACTFWMK